RSFGKRAQSYENSCQCWKYIFIFKHPAQDILEHEIDTHENKVIKNRVNDGRFKIDVWQKSTKITERPDKTKPCRTIFFTNKKESNQSDDAENCIWKTCSKFSNAK